MATIDCYAKCNVLSLSLSNLVFRTGWLFREIISCSFVCRMTFTQAEQISLIYAHVLVHVSDLATPECGKEGLDCYEKFS
jgi:hypothetical protein